MKKQRVIFDKTEVIMVYDVLTNPFKKGISKKALTYDKIQSISIEKCNVKRLFKTVDSERILIRAAGMTESIIYFKSVEKDYFDEYKAGFRKFAKANRITLYDSVDV